MPGPAVRCPACGHALFTVDEPAWPVRPAPPGPTAPAAQEAPLLLTVTRAAGLLGVSRSTLYQLVGAGRVPVVRLGRAVRVPRRELERLAEGGRSPPPATRGPLSRWRSRDTARVNRLLSGVLWGRPRSDWSRVNA